MTLSARADDDAPPRSAPLPIAAGDYLGPAEVTEVRGPSLEVEIPGGRHVPVTLALALPYEPVTGDVLLVIGRGEAHYVIGVIQGRGKALIAFHGDVELSSLDGKVVVNGRRGVELRGEEVEVRAGKLQMIADQVTQRFTSLHKRVVELLSVHAGESHTLVDEGSFTQSRRAVLQTEETVTINGKEIHLG